MATLTITAGLLTAPAALASAHPVRPPSAPGPKAASPASLQPLRALASALGAAGTGAAGYSGLTIDAATGHVDLYATGTAAARTITAVARRQAPGLRWSAVTVRTARYSRATLTRAAARLAGARPDVVRIVIPPDGSGLTATAVGARAAAIAPGGPGVPVHLIGGAEQAKSWAAYKWEDTAPFIGGDVLTPDGYHYCTAGLPTVKIAGGQQALVTAAHCFAVGTRVYTAAGTPGAFHNHRVGHYVGTVVSRDTARDSELIVGTANNADESDRTGWKALTGVARSHVGDYVCQNGAYSFFLGHPTPCGIKVTADDVLFKIDGHWARGVEGVDVLHGWGSHAGDSGGVVFALEAGQRPAGPWTRVLRGRRRHARPASAWTGSRRRTSSRAFGLRLNPRT